LPQVTRVHVPRPAQPRIDVEEPVALREDSVGFVDNSAELRDPAAAKAALEPLAGQIEAGGYRVSLVGTTASAGTEEGRRVLSLERAETVQRLLVGLGVPDQRISTRGVGTHHPQHVDDLDDEGNLIPEAAMKNRAVFVSVRR
jgi:outer membrane protein OmpA-like peptidoglycan-associated protein